MYAFRTIIQYLHHLIRTLPVRQSDFIRDFRHHVLGNTVGHPQFRIIEQARKNLCKNSLAAENHKLGAGTRSNAHKDSIGETARRISVGTRHGRLLYHLVSYYQPDLIIEMGTAFGISTLYLALANPATPVITVEGNAHYAAIAAKIFNAVQLGNITLINRPFNETVEELRSRITPRTLIFIDGNHTLEATWQYFGAFTSTLRSPTILVFDDINWSEEMRQAWKKITESPDSGTTIDLFRMGIVFPGKGKGNYRLLY